MSFPTRLFCKGKQHYISIEFATCRNGKIFVVKINKNSEITLLISNKMLMRFQKSLTFGLILGIVNVTIWCVRGRSAAILKHKPSAEHRYDDMPRRFPAVFGSGVSRHCGERADGCYLVQGFNVKIFYGGAQFEKTNPNSRNSYGLCPAFQLFLGCGQRLRGL